MEEPAGLRWPDREFPVTTGLGFYSIVSLAVTVLHTHQIVANKPHGCRHRQRNSYRPAAAAPSWKQGGIGIICHKRVTAMD